MNALKRLFVRIMPVVGNKCKTLTVMIIWSCPLETFETKDCKVWFDESLLKESPKDSLDIDFWSRKNQVSGSSEGRGTTWFVSTNILEAALRHYRRGGLLGKLIKDNYLFFGWCNTRSFKEFQLLSLLSNRGVNVPRPIAARAIKSGISYKADLLSEKISHSKDLFSILLTDKLSSAMYKKIGIEIRKMHDEQVNHIDLNIHNLLIDKDDKVWIIDFDKCHVKSGENWKKENISRLLRSFNKEKIKNNIHWDKDSFIYILDGYHHKGEY